MYMYLKSSKIHHLVLPGFDGFSTPQYSPANRAYVAMCTKSIKLHRLLLLDSVLQQYSPANRACSHVYQIHQTPPAAFDGFSTPQYSPVNRACTHMYQMHQTPPAAFVGFRTVYSQAMDALHLPQYQFHQSPAIGGPFYCTVGWNSEDLDLGF